MFGLHPNIPWLAATRCFPAHAEVGATTKHTPTGFFRGVVRRVTMRRLPADFRGIALRSIAALPVRCYTAFQARSGVGRWICYRIIFGKVLNESSKVRVSIS